MSRLCRAALALLTTLGTVVPAFAADGTQADDLRAEFSWGLQFGAAGGVATAYGLRVGYRAEAGAPQASLLQLDVNETGALARLAGLPVLTRAYHVDQNEAVQDLGETATDSKPWYARQWVLWTAGGLAATAALASSGGSSNNDGSTCTGVCSDGSSGPTSTGSVNGVGPDGIGCVGDTCAVPCDSDNKPAGCVPAAPLTSIQASRLAYSLDYERIRWLDAGTGFMGDLVARPN